MHVAQNWRLNSQRYSMKGTRCPDCQNVLFPPREVCPHCAAEEKKAAQASQAVALPEIHEVVLQRAAR